MKKKQEKTMEQKRKDKAKRFSMAVRIIASMLLLSTIITLVASLI